MPESLVKKIDKQARLTDGNRSDFIRQAVRKQLAILDQWQILTESSRASYSGKQLNEAEVAAIVRASREQA